MFEKHLWNGLEGDASRNDFESHQLSRAPEFKAKRFIGIERGGMPDEHPGEVGKDMPVPHFIGHRQRIAFGGLPDAGVIDLRAEDRQTRFDVAQTFAPRQPGERPGVLNNSPQHHASFLGCGAGEARADREMQNHSHHHTNHYRKQADRAGGAAAASRKKNRQKCHEE